MDPAEDLKRALFLGRHARVAALLARHPDLGRANFGLAVALYDVDHVRATLAADPQAATRAIGPRRPILHLAFSQYLHGGGDEQAMIAVAELLLEHGANPNDSYPYSEADPSPLPALYGAIGHADNMALAAWLLANGANPNDNESLYHSTEIGHHRGLRLLLQHGARPQGTNALLRAMDFDDPVAVTLLLQAGADPMEAGTTPALHQAARRRVSTAVMQRLLDHGARDQMFEGMTAYSLAQLHGADAVIRALEAADQDHSLTDSETILAAAAHGRVEGQLDRAELPDEARLMMCRIIGRDDALPHLKALAAIGLSSDDVDSQGLTPLQLAGWEGQLDSFRWLLTQSPDLAHINGYGGDIWGTILHGAENCPAREDRAHAACLEALIATGHVPPEGLHLHAPTSELAELLRNA